MIRSTSARAAGLRRTAALMWLATVGGATAAEDTEFDDLLRQQWYFTEVVVFQRPLVLDHLSEEALARPPERLPRNLRWLQPPSDPQAEPPPRSADFRLYPGMHAYLAFPFLGQALLPPPVDEDPFRDPLAGAADPSSAPDGPDADRDHGRSPPVIEPRLAPDPLLDFLRELAAFERSMTASSYRWLPPQTFTLDGEAARLQRRGGFQVLLHGRWLQPVPPRNAPEPLLFRAGPRYPDGHALEGTFAVTVGRFLHFSTGLYYREPLLGRAPVDRPQWPPAAPDMPLDRQPLRFDAAGVMQLRQARRLRSDELHYLDHPKLGVLVRVTPATPPPELSEAFAALQADRAEERQ